MSPQNDNDFTADSARGPRGVIIGVLICILAYTVGFGVPLFLLWWNQ